MVGVSLRIIKHPSKRPDPLLILFKISSVHGTKSSGGFPDLDLGILTPDLFFGTFSLCLKKSP